jgi:NAD(P)-dependent dehydrogenase (short-subunit alcohol dehydrogenase family)
MILRDGKAVVVGGGSGIGRATARRIAAEGAAVAVIDIDESGAQETVMPFGGIALGADATDHEQLCSAIHEAARALGGLTILCNAAGASAMCRIHDWPPDEWDRLVRLNLTGVFYGMKAAAPIMLDTLDEGTTGAIVNIASISGTRPAGGEAPYAAAKAGVAALTASAALEYAPRIRVNAVSPGMIRTKMTEPLFATFSGIEEDLARRTPLGRIGEPEDIADVIAFLCSSLARFVTGQNVVVDGGMTLHGSAIDGVLERLEALLAGPAGQS